MSGPDSLDADREARQTALTRLTGHFEQFRAKPIKERLSDDVQRRVEGGLREAAEVVADSKPIIAGTVGALALWFLRKPIAGQVSKAWPKLKNRFSKDREA
jgi:hypothetical protein